MVVKALATKKKKPVKDFYRYLTLLYGREKIGKTTILSRVDGIYFITTEPGTKGMEIYETQVETWRDFKSVVRLLAKEAKKAKPRWKIVAIDTVDEAYVMCSEHVCDEMGIEAPGETPSGKKDYGKSWGRIKSEFRKEIQKLTRAGFGVVFTSHCKEEEHESRTGQKYWRVYPTMSGQARSVVEALVDFLIYCEYVKDARGKRKRVMVTLGDETVFAGSRKTVSGTLPPVIEMTETEGFNILRRAFEGEDVGLNVDGYSASGQSSKAGTRLLRQVAAKKGAKTKTSVKRGTPVRRKKVARKRKH